MAKGDDMNIISGPICRCQHTHTYGGVAYIDCPYCECHEHTHELAIGTFIYNVKRFNRWIKKHKQPYEKIDEAINSEIAKMMQTND